ncbi:DUF2079 domain-containing protein [Synechocystis sp. LKSZ1]|uniref:DUF2079 domain-containing protein n=1 Tax=Synechocystis sp. LKSZ1 TaxID=3144951 RepID=UPI00336C218A
MAGLFPLNTRLPVALWKAVGVSFMILLGASSLRHLLYHSTAWDLGIFDQAIYLISQGQPPISSFLQGHILGDHAAFIFYPLALLYWVYPSVYWLLGLQAFALALGAVPCYGLARQAGLSCGLALTLAYVYLLYPLVFNLNLFDFHPDALALPALLGAIWAARARRPLVFTLLLVLICSCKAVLALAVVGLGAWLGLEKRWPYAGIALGLGIIWFGLATQIIIPYFSQNPESISRHLSRYGYLGASFTEIAANLLFKPWLFLGGLFNGPNLGYCLLLVLPLLWGLHPHQGLALVALLPFLLMNLLSQDPSQKDLLHQYSLPMLPFLLVIVIDSLAAQTAWIRSRRWILVWSLVCFLALAKIGYFWERYLTTWDTWQATQTAIAKITPTGSVLTNANIAPHLTHRPMVQLIIPGAEKLDLTTFDYILLNQRHPGQDSSPEVVQALIAAIQENGHFQTQFQQDGVMLFTQPTAPLALDSVNP